MEIIDVFKSEISSKSVKIRLTPWSNKNEIFGQLTDGTFKIRIKAPAENWKANKELISFLSKFLEVKKSEIEIVSWELNQNKVIKLKK